MNTLAGSTVGLLAAENPTTTLAPHGKVIVGAYDMLLRLRAIIGDG